MYGQLPHPRDRAAAGARGAAGLAPMLTAREGTLRLSFVLLFKRPIALSENRQ